MIVTDQQVRKLLMEHQKTGVIKTAAMMAGMNRKTAAGYIGDGQLPSERKSGHEWRTKPDPFEVYWPEVAAKLQDAPELEAKALFEWLTERYPGMFQAGQVRTLQRRIQQWRGLPMCLGAAGPAVRQAHGMLAPPYLAASGNADRLSGGRQLETQAGLNRRQQRERRVVLLCFLCCLLLKRTW